MRPKLYISELRAEAPNLTDLIRENFILLDGFIKAEPFLNGEFKHYEIIVEAAVTNLKFQHRLTFVPKDIIQTFLTDAVTLTWKYDEFDATNIQFTTSAACTVRFFVGRYRKETGVQ